MLVFYLGQMGVQALTDMVGGAVVQAGAKKQKQQALDNLSKSMDEDTRMTMQQVNDPMGFGMQMPGTAAEADMPQFPEQAAAQLQQRQEENAAERQQFTANMKDEFADLRSGFFDENHLELPEGDTPEQQVANGDPKTVAGKETTEQRNMREAYEGTKQDSMAMRQQNEKDTLMQNEKDKMQTFLQQNKPDLGNPAVQGELQKAIVAAHKKSLSLSKKHEEETIKCNLYTDDHKSIADQKLAQLQDMEERHAQEELNSPEAQELINHQQSLADMMRGKQEEVHTAAAEDVPTVAANPFPNGPRYNLSDQAVKKDLDVAEVLPPYLSNALYNLGIYTV